jgi:hypothetical protein
METRTLLGKQWKNLIVFTLPQKEKEKFKRRDNTYLKLKKSQIHGSGRCDRGTQLVGAKID